MTKVVLKRVGHGPHGRGEIRIWQKPVEDAEYILGADVAQGSTFGTAKQSADKSTICILRRDGMMVHQVAEAVYQVENFAFGQIIAAMGAWYNHAIVNVERNLAHGVVAGLRVAQYPQDRWYIPPVSASTTDAISGNYFFHKNSSTQKILLDTLLAYMDPNATRLILQAGRTLAEVASLQMDALGRVDTNGKDLTIALAMAVIVDATTEVDLRKEPPKEPPKRVPYGVDPTLWKQVNGMAPEHKPQSADEAPDWEGGPGDGSFDWSAFN